MIDYLNITLTPEQLSVVSELALAHVGDAVFELLVRTELCAGGSAKVKELHAQTVARVTAPAQAAFVEALLPRLTEEEAAVYRRGRNAHSHAAPKSATPGQYARATGLETLFGWLWLTGQKARISELYALGREL
ncbi:MAG: ribonuclease III [Oscillospiraceae bacterium]|nr:ribonuclease III [Oscillospiraceae bacterium]MBQ6159762.1 ribonuclease III [Oscillospiraceae bacterium]